MYLFLFIHLDCFDVRRDVSLLSSELTIKDKTLIFPQLTSMILYVNTVSFNLRVGVIGANPPQKNVHPQSRLVFTLSAEISLFFKETDRF